MTDRSVAEPRSAARALLILGGIVVVGILLVLGVIILIDRQASSDIAAVLYELIGNPDEAQALRRGGGDRFIAKLILAGIALVLGVGVIWLFYAGMNALVERFSPDTQRRLLPWVFVGPALLLLHCRWAPTG